MIFIKDLDTRIKKFIRKRFIIKIFFYILIKKRNRSLLLIIKNLRKFIILNIL